MYVYMHLSIYVYVYILISKYTYLPFDLYLSKHRNTSTDFSAFRLKKDKIKVMRNTNVVAKLFERFEKMLNFNIETKELTRLN